MDTTELLSIGRFARLAGVSVGALRHYDELELLTPASVNPETGYRSYARSQVDTARLIRHLRELELPLGEIRSVLTADADGRTALIARHRAGIQARIFRLQHALHQLSKEDFMTTPSPEPALDHDSHRRLAAELFNHVWTLLEAEARTPEQDDEMLHGAHASRWHWAQTGVPDMRQRLAVGEWQCSRVYAVLERAEPSLHHARRCLELADDPGVEPWVMGSAYEALARASRVAGDRSAFEAWRERARSAVAAIEDDGDREVLEGDLATLGG